MTISVRRQPPACRTSKLRIASARTAGHSSLSTAQPPLTGPHALGSQRRDGRGRIGESLQSLEAAAARDAVASRARLFQAFFEIRPVHNPLGPFDFAGSYDERSDRAWALTDLIDRGFDDGYRQFVNPVVAPSGEEMQPTPRPRPPTPVSPAT